MTFEEADGCVVIRPVPSKQALVEARLLEARGVAGAGTTTDDLMRLTRGDDRVFLVDTNVLLDIFTDDATWRSWPKRAVRDALVARGVAINPVVPA